MQNLLFFIASLLPELKHTTVTTNVDSLTRVLRADPEIAETASVNAVSCSKYACRIIFHVKDEDGSKFQMAVFRFVQANPEFGYSFKFEDNRNDPSMAIFVIYKENIPYD
jgi:hypothetical protein